MPPDRLLVGRILRPHGIRGEVVVEIESEAPDRFAAGTTFDAGGSTLTVKSARPHQGRLLVRFGEVGDRNAAEALRGTPLTISAAEAAPLGEWSFYPHELEGFDVVDSSGKPLGRWLGSVANPAHDVWIVRSARGEIMVPAVRDIVREVDRGTRRIVLDPPEGLFD